MTTYVRSIVMLKLHYCKSAVLLHASVTFFLARLCATGNMLGPKPELSSYLGLMIPSEQGTF